MLYGTNQEPYVTFKKKKDLRQFHSSLQIATENSLEFNIIPSCLPFNVTQVAVQRMDEKVCDAQKKLDLEKYKTSKKMAQLEELQTQYNQMQKDASDAVATDAGESEEAEVG